MLGCAPVGTLWTFSHIPDDYWGWSGMREVSLSTQGCAWFLHFALTPGGLLALTYLNGSHTCPSENRGLHPDPTVGCSSKTASFVASAVLSFPGLLQLLVVQSHRATEAGLGIYPSVLPLSTVSLDLQPLVKEWGISKTNRNVVCV